MLSYKDSIRAYIKFNFAVHKLNLSLQELFISYIIFFLLKHFHLDLYSPSVLMLETPR